jgi:hypothetical protein
LTAGALVGPRLFTEPRFEIERQLYSAEGVQPLRSTVSLEDALKSLMYVQLNHNARKLSDSKMFGPEPASVAINDQTFVRDQERLYERRVREVFEFLKPFYPGQEVAAGEAWMRLEGVGAPQHYEVLLLVSILQFRLGVP